MGSGYRTHPHLNFRSERVLVRGSLLRDVWSYSSIGSCHVHPYRYTCAQAHTEAQVSTCTPPSLTQVQPSDMPSLSQSPEES